MISIFKTNVHTEVELQQIVPNFKVNVPNLNWHIDLTDCDKILRVDSPVNMNDIVIALFNKLGFSCVVLEVFHAPPK
ncbi:hypothetical protein [Pedobacter jejuensis]|uniref:Uncharacterized protein n=1 Tax=Pedobacter jejuensis TaxID=1268550 RepID=A0A3N0BSU5_9SPHI|nr:hypothetical protein [Pedobacter jejuensis]RNL52151.1 hypothetical protein D7004_11235 [Pedobacter jejuensis]